MLLSEISVLIVVLPILKGCSVFNYGKARRARILKKLFPIYKRSLQQFVMFVLGMKHKQKCGGIDVLQGFDPTHNIFSWDQFQDKGCRGPIRHNPLIVLDQPYFPHMLGKAYLHPQFHYITSKYIPKENTPFHSN
jgi:hypothetical protein